MVPGKLLDDISTSRASKSYRLQGETKKASGTFQRERQTRQCPSRSSINSGSEAKFSHILLSHRESFLLVTKKVYRFLCFNSRLPAKAKKRTSHAFHRGPAIFSYLVVVCVRQNCLISLNRIWHINSVACEVCSYRKMSKIDVE